MHALLVPGVIVFALSVDVLQARALGDDGTDISAGAFRPSTAIISDEGRGLFTNLTDLLQRFFSRLCGSLNVNMKASEVQANVGEALGTAKLAESGLDSRLDSLLEKWAAKNKPLDTFFNSREHDEMMKLAGKFKSVLRRGNNDEGHEYVEHKIQERVSDLIEKVTSSTDSNVRAQGFILLSAYLKKYGKLVTNATKD